MKFILIVFLFCIATINAQQVSDFQLKDLQNKSQNFSDLKGEKITVIDFWATWCKPCLHAIPELNKLYAEFKDQGVNFIGIACDGPRSIAKVAPLAGSLQIKYSVLLDINAEIKTRLNVMSLPTLLIVNEKGKIIWQHEGYLLGDEVKIRDKIISILKIN